MCSKAVGYLALLALLVHHVAFAEPPPAAREAMEELTMASAIAKANRNNPALYGRRLQQELYEINYEDAWSRMYLPSINLTSTLYSPYTIAQMPGSPDAGMGGAARQHGFQSAGVALNLGQYTVFNWGRDFGAGFAFAGRPDFTSELALSSSHPMGSTVFVVTKRVRRGSRLVTCP